MDALNEGRFSQRHCLWAACCLLIFSHATCFGLGTDVNQHPASVTASPMQDDATIHDLVLIGPGTGWAVGDRGAIWKTADGGHSWQFVHAAPHLEDYTLESVCFLTDRVGWIAGGTVSPVGRVDVGVILSTTDGGENWTILSGGQLPYLRKVQFFDFDNGIAIGERSVRYPSGMMTTTDGGQTWNPVYAEQNATWNDAEFFDRDIGLAVGDQGTQFNVANGRLFSGGGNIGGLQSLHDLSIQLSGDCWLVGDGALVLKSLDRGVSWTPPQSAFPEHLDEFTNFQCVEQRDGHVWLTGNPGSVIWHSADGGESWQQQFTGASTPLEVIRFSDTQHGVAAGALGRICMTSDGGKTWTNVRGGNRRLAVWGVHGHVQRVSLSFLTRWSREAGYRSAVTVASRRDVGSDAFFAKDQRIHLHHAVQVAGGNCASIDWRLPIAIAGLDRDHGKLLQEWSSLTDRRLPEVLLRSLVGQIRTWKPDVILLDEPPADDAVTKVIQQALPQAVAMAADPSRFPEQLGLGLAPWQVRKVAMERLVGNSGAIQQRAFEILPHVGTTLDVATLQAASRLLENIDATAMRSYEVLYLSPLETLSKSSILGDLKIAINSDARRIVPAIQAIDYDRLMEEARHRQTMTAISQQLIDSPEQGAQLLAQISEIVKPLSREQAARQLSDLALKFRTAGQWSLAEETYAQLIINYPDQPVALEAMLWLVEFSTSAEMNWQRLRAIRSTSTNIRTDPAIVQANFQEALKLAGKHATQAGFQKSLQGLQAGTEATTTQLVPTLGDSPAVLNGNASGANQYDLQLRRWQQTAATIVDDLSTAYPRLFEDDEMQFVVAALLRRRKQSRKADEIYDRYLQRLNDDDPWHVAAKGETFLIRPGAISPKPVVSCRQTESAPVLDGRLTDSCWSEASEIKLGGDTSSTLFVGAEKSSGGRVAFVDRQPIVMFARDAEYLYVAGSVPKSDAMIYAPTQLPGRPRDADVGKHDYVTIQFDIDRDYATYYRFDIDQRGWTREACWDAWSYNPEWFVACEQDTMTWSFEVAIPLLELIPSELNPRDVWAIGVTRVMPGTGVQSWTNSGGEQPLPPRFGFLRFE